MKRSIVYVVICFVLMSCFVYVVDFPMTCLFITYLCGVAMVFTQKFPSIQNYFNKKLD